MYTSSFGSIYEIRWQDGTNFRVFKDEKDMFAEVKSKFPQDYDGYIKFLKDCEKRYLFGFEGLGRKPMNKLWDLLKKFQDLFGFELISPSTVMRHPG